VWDSLASSCGQSVGRKQCLPLVLVVLDWVVAVGREDEVGGNELCALVEQLEERVLCVGCWFSEKDWTCGVVDVFSITSDGLAVGLHGELLEIGWETVHVLIESGVMSVSHIIEEEDGNLRCNEMCLSTEEVRVPHAQQTTNDWNVLLQWCVQEVLVHGVSTSKELVEVVVANV
jgi:hypothetical protein